MLFISSANAIEESDFIDSQRDLHKISLEEAINMALEGNIELKEIMVEGVILAKGERNLTKFDKKNINKYLDDKISFNQLLIRIFSNYYEIKNQK